jgi:hypothetical protein
VKSKNPKEKKIDVFLNLAIGFAIVVIIFILLYKFVLNDSPANEPFKVKNLKQINVTDLKGNYDSLEELLAANENTYCLIFELTNCYPCIQKGLDDLNELLSDGNKGFAIVVSNYYDEVEGWASKMASSTPVFVLKKSAFYENIHCTNLPVLVRFKNVRVENYRFITP